MGDAAQLKDRPYAVAAFRAFLDTRPDDELWELIAGIAGQSAAPRISGSRASASAS